MYLVRNHCLVCRVQLNDYDPGRNTNEVVEAFQGKTVKTCVEKVLDIKIPTLSDTFICNKCYTDLIQIETYYRLLEDFRARYQKGLQGQPHVPPLQTLFNDPIPQTNPLIPEEDSSILLQPNQPTFDLLGMGFQSSSESFQGSCRYASSPQIIPRYERENESNVVHTEGGNELLGLKNESEPTTSEVPAVYPASEQSTPEHNDEAEGSHAHCKPTGEQLEGDEIFQDQVKEEALESGSESTVARRDTSEEREVHDEIGEGLPPSAEEFVCSICNKSFHTERRLRRHMICHTGSGPYKCTICGKGFANEKSLSIHGMTHPNGEDSGRRTRSSLSANQEVQVKEEPEEAAVEPEHIKMIRLRNKCSLCGKSFAKIRELRLHKSHVHGKNGYLICPECGDEFLEASELRSHLKCHYEDSQWKCHICGSGFRREANLRAHLSVKCSDKRYSCNLCNKGFVSPSGLRAHIRTHTGEMPYECNFCKKKFNNSSNYKAHLRIHTGETPFKCSICSMAFTQSGQRNVHEKTHAEEPSYSCDKCGKGFYWPTAYKKHLRIHTDIKTHLCSFCGKKFREMGELTTHIKTHSDVRPYKCSFCEKGFKTSKHKKVHERIHTGERPFICHMCGRGFTQITGLKFHMKTHNSDNSLEV